MPLANNTRVVFPHIAKTGGTTLHSHFRGNLPEHEFYGYGVSGRARQFFSNQYQIEEQTPSEKASIAVAQGHRVDEGVVTILGDPNVKLMIVLRHPVAWQRSRFNHRFNALARHGRTMTASEYLDRTGDNALASSLVENFPSFIDDPGGDILAQSRSILSKFDYVLTTERLDEQAAAVFPSLGLPGRMERKRTAEKKHRLDVSDEELLERNSVDFALFAEANAKTPEAGDSHNGLGFDRIGKEGVIERLLTRPQPSEAYYYDHLARALTKSLLGEAAMAKIEQEPEKVAVRNLAHFVEVLSRAVDMKMLDMNEVQERISARKKANWRRLFLKRDKGANKNPARRGKRNPQRPHLA